MQLSQDQLKWRWFSTGDAFCKAILCLYAYFQPRSFETDALVKIDNSWLKVANSKNYHHFFPRAYLRKQGYENWQTNSILNITIVDDYLNKRRIQANAPSQYMKEFLKNNPDLEKTMKTHLIDDLKTFGVFGSFGRGDNYEQFLEKRGERILRELNKRLYPTL